MTQRHDGCAAAFHAVCERATKSALSIARDDAAVGGKLLLMSGEVRGVANRSAISAQPSGPDSFDAGAANHAIRYNLRCKTIKSNRQGQKKSPQSTPWNPDL
jgi:hypothetical protein